MKLYNRAEELMTVADRLKAIKDVLSSIAKSTAEDMMSTEQEQDAMKHLYSAIGLTDNAITATLRARAKAITAKPNTKSRHFKFVDGDMVEISEEEWERDFKAREENAIPMNPEYEEIPVDNDED